MTQEEALKEAVRRWGSKAFIGGTGHGWSVGRWKHQLRGKTRQYGYTVYGEGKTFEEAFANARPV